MGYWQTNHRLHAAAEAGARQIMPNTGLPAYWYLHIPDLFLAALTCLLLARLVLAPALGTGNIAMRTLAAITDPIAATVGAVTPRIVPAALIVVFAMVWLSAARILLFMAMTAMGVRQ